MVTDVRVLVNIGDADVLLVLTILVAVFIDLQFINVTKIILLFFYSIILPSGFIIYINTLSFSAYKTDAAISSNTSHCLVFARMRSFTDKTR